MLQFSQLCFNLTSQIRRVWRVQRELLRDKSRLYTLRPLQEQSLLIGCPASCELHKPVKVSPSLSPLVFLASYNHRCCTYLSRALAFMAFLRPYCVAKTGYKKGHSHGEISTNFLYLKISSWAYVSWAVDPTQMAGLSLSPDRPLSRTPIQSIVQPLLHQLLSVCFCSVNNNKQANTPL